MDKLKLPPLPRQQSSGGQEKNPRLSVSRQEKQQGGRYLTEVNGVPVWLESSRTSATSPQQGTSSSEQVKQLASSIKRKLGISEK